MISKKTREAIVKKEGSINGEQCNIEECNDCDIFILDYTATVYVDLCENCRIFVGPTESSVFVRECRSCDFMIACQQFRSRDCHQCRCALFCTTEPIIETSTDIRFGCFDFSYFTLRQQMIRAKLTLWNNKWWQVHDFNKNVDRPNWSILPQEEVPTLLRLDACAGTLSADEAAMDRVVPITLGSREWPSKESCFVTFLPGSDHYIEEFLMTATNLEWTLARTRCMPLSEERCKLLFAWTKDSKLISQCIDKEITGIEVCGQGVYWQVEEHVKKGASKNVRIVPEQETQSLAGDFFEKWKDEV